MTEVEAVAGADWAGVIAGRLVATLEDALTETGRAAFAGAGGSTPSPIYRRMAGADLDWSKVVVTLVDERDVGETSPESNAALIRRDLGDAASASQFVPLRHAAVTIDRAALMATRALADTTPRLDAVLLGMGEDGHICSMFPHSPMLKTLLDPTLTPQVLAVPPGRDGLAPPQGRFSMNLPYLLTARRIVLALTGPAKRAVFEREQAGDPRTQPIAALIAANAPLDVVWTEAAP